MSFFKDGHFRSYMKKAGVDVEWPVTLFQRNAFYKSDQVWDQFATELSVFLEEGGQVSDVVANCEKLRDEGKILVEELKVKDASPVEKLKELYGVFTQIISHVWLAHGFEHIFAKRLREEVPKYMDGDLEKNIGDISFPLKKNEHYYLEEALKSNMSIEEVRNKYSWIKARYEFNTGFTTEELEIERKRLNDLPLEEEFKHPHIPKELTEVSKIAQELVYYRTLRTDVLYELLYLSRPILREVAEHYSLSFEELRDYSAQDLISGKLERYELDDVTVISYGENHALVRGPVVDDKQIENVFEFRGSAAFKGVVRGVAKVAMSASDTDKVKEGDILIAPTTAPSYIMAMKRAAAFITDEGGITSHASIVAREMRKPCIIGTKIATKVLKDGDLVEVDADKGIVRKI
ncbi:MAG: PEP-utilizing enzyme [Candidatus Paceibacterota bacterium]